MFGNAGIMAQCLGDTLAPMKTYSGANINKLTNKENFELQENAFKLLQDTVGVKKKYLELEMVCATWLAVLNSVNISSNHTFTEKREDLEMGFKVFLSIRINDFVIKGISPRLLSMLNKYL